MHDLWTELAARADLPLSEQQDKQLRLYLQLLMDANQRMNLTRIPDLPAAELQHVADALTLLPYLPPTPHRVADVGSGGGVPGIPLAILRPDARVVLIESTKKKAVFLKQTAAAIGLTNVMVLDLRAEEVGRSYDREQFDVAVARAVATIDWLAEWCLPLVAKGGKMLAMKGPKVLDELPDAAYAIRQCGGLAAVTHAVALPGTDNRLIVEIIKVQKTDPRFPRPATVAKSKPLRP